MLGFARKLKVKSLVLIGYVSCPCSCLENPREGGIWGLPSMGSHRVGHDWSNLTAAAAYVTLAVTYSISYVMPEIKGSGILIYGWNWAQPASYLFGSSLIITTAQKTKAAIFRYLKIVLWIFPALPKFSVLSYPPKEPYRFSQLCELPWLLLCEK